MVKHPAQRSCSGVPLPPTIFSHFSEKAASFWVLSQEKCLALQEVRGLLAPLHPPACTKIDFPFPPPLSNSLPSGRCSGNHKVLGSKLRSKKPEAVGRGSETEGSQRQE